jgi:putative glutamine amidotransferase
MRLVSGSVSRGHPDGAGPRIVVTLSDPEGSSDSAATNAKNRLYLEAVEHAGGHAVPLDEHSPPDIVAAELDAMDGLLLSGGPDLDPSLYGEHMAGGGPAEPGRDALELAAWRGAAARRVPVLGICRGFQALNVFLGGQLVQHVEGHAPAYPPPGAVAGEPPLHPLRVDPASQLAQLLGLPPGRPDLRVNSYHHQAVRGATLARRWRASAWSPHPNGELVEAAEIRDEAWFVIGVQCHPERTETTPPEFARLFAAFVAAARRERNPAR